MLFAASFAYQLSIKVTVTQDTLSVGSNVSLETSGVEIAAGRTGDDGIVKFNVSNGSYFAILKSTLYPKQVTLIEVNGDTAVTLTKRQQISYATAYGQIIGPTDFSNATISAMQNNRVQKKVTSDSNGYYVLSLYGLPDGAYDIVFEAPGYDKISSHEYLPLSEFVEVNAKMSATAVPVELEPVLFAPAQVQQSSFVEISLTKGGSPLVGEIVAVDTPAGKINLPPTDSSGKAGINAAQSGLYVFTYGKLSSSTAVLPKQAPAPVPAPTPVPTVTPQLPVPAPSQQPNEQGGSVILAGATLFFILLLVGLLILIVWVKAIAPALAKKKHAHHETHPEHAHSETHKHEQHGATHKKAAPHKKK
ncbi:MAG: carboxypeptidase-like regulatory domain-containing protein [Candidatus Micrarchaeota archaeon]|nr:carboxypeptidase-like regulatory domain-containing protein [Candidatus Micrarchaeota archaeon]